MLLFRSITAVVLLGVLSRPSAAPARVSGQSASERVVLGVLRSDGILLPFAAFDGDDDWSTPWPATLDPATGGPSELPVNLAAVPPKWWGGEVPGQWRLWRGGSKVGLLVAPIAPVVILVGVERRLGVRTDFRAGFNPFIPPFELPYPKEGLAVAGDVSVEPISTVSPLAPKHGTLLGQLRSDIDNAEERTISALRSNARWTHPIARAVRSKTAPELEAWYTGTLAEPGGATSYIEAVKKYPPQPSDEGCGLETFISGWVYHLEGEERPKTRLQAVVTYCDRESASYMLPLGQMRLRNRTHWIYQMSGHDHEWYTVVELTPGRTRYRAEYHAGGVPSVMR